MEKCLLHINPKNYIIPDLNYSEHNPPYISEKQDLQPPDPPSPFPEDSKLKNLALHAPAAPPSYKIQTNPRPNNPKPIFITIANVSSLTLTRENLGTIFRLANQYTLNTPYPLGDWPMRHDGNTAYRPNHNGTHSARQTAYLDAIFDFVQSKGSDQAQQLYSRLSEDELLNLQLAAYFLRAGRVDESSHLDPPADDYNTRSAFIYEQYAIQLGVNPSTIQWIKKLIINSCKKFGERDWDIDSDPKNKFCFEALSLAHDLDLVRCFEPEKMEYVTDKMRNRLKSFTSKLLPAATRNQYLSQLMQYARDVCDATGCHRIADGTVGNRDQFMACSIDGEYGWKAAHSVKVPKWV